MTLTFKTSAIISADEKLMPVDLYDTINIQTINERKIQILKISGYKIPTNDKNPVYRIATALQKLRPNKFGAKISIQKNIPTFSGLNSQLSNAAGTLIALNRLWGFHLPEKKLMQIARSVDPKMATILKAFLKPASCKKKFVLIRPKHIVIDPEWRKKHNPLSYFPDLKALIRTLKEQGAETAELSGQGSMVFGRFREPVDLKTLKKTLKRKTDFIWTGNSCNKGSELIN